MSTTTVTICITTAAGSKASRVGERYAATFEGDWRNSVDACDANGCGRVFVMFPDEAAYDAASEVMDGDDDVISYRDA
jgi:hypothetical protein